MTKEAFSRANVAYGFNLYYGSRNRKFFSISKEEAIAFCKGLGASKMVVVDDYLEGDFTLFLYK